MSFTNQEKARYTLLFHKLGYVEFRRQLRREGGRRSQVPSRSTVRNWISQFEKNGTILDLRSENHRPLVRTEEVVERVRVAFDAQPHLSMRRNPTGLPKTTVNTVLRKDLHWHPYKLQLVHELGNPDFSLRLLFAQNQLAALSNNPGLLQNLIFSDEAHFYLNGEVNRQDFRLWSPENPHWFSEEPLHSQKVTVWLGIGIQGVVGPFFWEPLANERGINGRWYESLLRDQVIPALRQWPNFADLVFQQDGAPPHYATAVRYLLDQTFPNRWMGRGSSGNPAPVAWPPRSPDLNPLDFWLWGDLKQKVFTRNWRPNTLEQLRAVIQSEVQKIRNNVHVRERVFADFQQRLQVCIDRGGMQVERR